MSYASTVLADGAIGYWRLGEPSGTNAADAASIQAGTYSATGITLAQTGIAGAGGDTAALFTSASSGKVSIPVVAGNTTTDTLSVEAWVKRTSSANYLTIFSSSPTTGGFAFRIDQTTNLLNLGCPSLGAIAPSTVALTDTTAFHHVAFTKAGSAVHLYLDGTDVTGAVTNRTLATATAYAIGFSLGDTTFYFDGTIDEVALYPTALAAATIANHHTLGLTSGPPAPGGGSNLPRTRTRLKVF